MSQAVSPRLRLEMIEQIVVVHFVDERLVSEEVIQEVSDQLDQLFESQGHSRLLLNLGQVTSMSSSMLGRLIRLHRKLKAASGRLVLCGLSPIVREVFHITQFDRVFDIEADELTAFERF